MEDKIRISDKFKILVAGITSSYRFHTSNQPRMQCVKEERTACFKQSAFETMQKILWEQREDR